MERESRVVGLWREQSEEAQSRLVDSPAAAVAIAGVSVAERPDYAVADVPVG